ncbi:MAG TPA: hypothetical protein VLC08_09805 [Chitinolyticbacter sp.]|nr:hypothetical protein [Chitinolyticbacter sp.]
MLTLYRFYRRLPLWSVALLPVLLKYMNCTVFSFVLLPDTRVGCNVRFSYGAFGIVTRG